MFRRITALILTLCTALSLQYFNVIAEEDDPLVSLSYIEQVLKPQLTEEITKEVKAQLMQELASGYQPVTSEHPYTDLSVTKGSTVFLPKGSEVMLRSGGAVILSYSMDEGSGLTDFTREKELFSGDSLGLFSLCTANSDVFILITQNTYLTLRGKYEID